MKWSLAILLVVLAGASASSQEVTGPRHQHAAEKAGYLTGVVTDFWGAVLPDVRLTATDRKGRRFEAITGESGEFKLRLASGRYRLIFQPSSYYIPAAIDDYQMPYEGKMRLDMSLPCKEPCKVVD
jgi:hypothetical protein